MKVVLNGLAIIIVMLFLSGLFGLFKPTPKQPATEPQPTTQQVVQQPAQQEAKQPVAVEKEDPGDLVIVKKEWDLDEERGFDSDHMNIVGEIKNTSNKVYRYVEADIIFTDDSGAQIGSKMTNTINLQPGQSWKFKVPVYGNKMPEHANIHVSGHI